MALQYRDALAKKNYEEGLRQKAEILSRIEKLKLISTSSPQLLKEQKDLFNVNQNLKKFAPVEDGNKPLELSNNPGTVTEKPFKENKDNINASPYGGLEVSKGTTQKKSDGTIVKQEGGKSSPSIPSGGSTKTSAKSFNTQSTNSISGLLGAINETRRQINEGTDKLIGEANSLASKSLTTLRNDNQGVKRGLLLDAGQRTAVLQGNATRAGLSAQSAVGQVAQVNSDVYTKTTEQDSLTDQKAQATMTNLQNYITQLESNRNNGNVNVNNQLQQAQALYGQLVQQFGDGTAKTSSTTTSSPTTGSSSGSSSSSSGLINKIKQAQKTGSNNTPTVTAPKTTPEKPFVSGVTPTPGKKPEDTPGFNGLGSNGFTYINGVPVAKVGEPVVVKSFGEKQLDKYNALESTIQRNKFLDPNTKATLYDGLTQPIVDVTTKQKLIEIQNRIKKKKEEEEQARLKSNPYNLIYPKSL